MTSSLDEALEVAFALCKEFEGLRLKPYLCPAGKPTIGVGATVYEDGTKVTLKDAPISEKRAVELTKNLLKASYLQPVARLSPNLTTLPTTWGAIGSFAYNLGVEAYAKSKLRELIEAEDWSTAQVEIKRWTRAKGAVLPGLVKRRNAEAALIVGKANN